MIFAILSSPWEKASSGFSIFCSSSSERKTIPSIPGVISTKTPKSVRRTILVLTRSPIFCRLKKSSQISPSSCFMPSDNFCFSTSMFKMMASTSSLAFSFSEGCFIFFQEILEIWMRPSTPFSTSMNAPKSVMLVIVPLTRAPGLYFCLSNSKG
ncbi:hypothetical protein ES703_59977 [subsurface metagenome]